VFGKTGDTAEWSRSPSTTDHRSPSVNLSTRNRAIRVDRLTLDDQRTSLDEEVGELSTDSRVVGGGDGIVG
jgi:hypothetical protein